MSTPLTRRVAQAAWLLPLFFLGISLHQGSVVYDLFTTNANGTEVTAEVQEIHIENRTQVTYDYVSLRIPLPDGSVLTRERLSLPHGIVPALDGKETLSVRVGSGPDPSLVITEPIGPTPVVETQMRIAGINGLMSFGAAVLFGVCVFYWNRSLRRQGDPADRGVSEPDPDHPAGTVVRT
ncbi:MAG: hypothetical protein ACLFTE_05120 [Salinivenus sp.]